MKGVPAALLDIRQWHHRIGGCRAAQHVISMANGALIPYHGCHSNTDDSDFSDSIAFVRTPDVALCHHSSGRFQCGDH